MEKYVKNKSSGLPRLVRQVNLQTVIRQMRGMEFFSKIELARQLGISTTTMTKLFAQLEEDGLIEKSPVEDRSFGRPKILYQLSPALQVAAIVIDVDHTSICFSGLQGNILAGNEISFPTGSDYKALMGNIRKEFGKLRKSLNAKCRIAGICIPGLIESGTGRSMLNPNLPWMEGFSPAEQIEQVLQLSTFIMHDEMALCRAQLRATDDATDYIAMDFSAGVGMSVISNGQHLTGTSGFAGEIGHVIMQSDGKLCGCGNRGCLETIASDRVLSRETRLSLEDAMEKLATGDPCVLQAANQVVEAQANGIAAAINIFNPEKIFIHSKLAESYPDYIEVIRKEVEKRAINISFHNCAINTTRDGKLKGALLQTIDHLIEMSIH